MCAHASTSPNCRAARQGTCSPPCCHPFKRVQDLDLGYLDDGVNDHGPNWDVVGVDGNDERGSESEDEEEQRELWISDEEKEVPDGADAFGQADEESEGMQVDDDLDNVM